MATSSSAEEALTHVTLSVITDRLKLLATRRAEMWWDIGCLLDAMATRGFAQEVGIRDYASYTEKVVGIKRDEARRLRRLAQLFSRDAAMRFGQQKLELLVQLVEVLPETIPVVDPLRVGVLSRRPDNTVQTISFAECSIEDLRFSIRTLARRSSTDDCRFNPVISELRDVLDEALYKALARRAPRVRIERDAAKAQEGLALFGLQPNMLETVGRVLIAEAKSLARAAKKQTPAKARKQRRTANAKTKKR